MHYFFLYNLHIFLRQFFKLYTGFESGNTLTVEDLYDNLLAIVEESLEKTVPVGILSAENRDTWADCYQILEKGIANNFKMMLKIFWLYSNGTYFGFGCR